jgi:DNA-binding XRE family transcriptional regulator
LSTVTTAVQDRRTTRDRAIDRGDTMHVRDHEALRRWRQRRGLSQRDLAYLCRCTQATISLLERGEMRSLTDELALSLSARLQVPWDELFDPRPVDSAEAHGAPAHAQGEVGVAGSPGGP